MSRINDKFIEICLFWNVLQDQETDFKITRPVSTCFHYTSQGDISAGGRVANKQGLTRNKDIANMKENENSSINSKL